MEIEEALRIVRKNKVEEYTLTEFRNDYMVLERQWQQRFDKGILDEFEQLEKAYYVIQQSKWQSIVNKAIDLLAAERILYDKEVGESANAYEVFIQKRNDIIKSEDSEGEKYAQINELYLCYLIIKNSQWSSKPAISKDAAAKIMYSGFLLWRAGLPKQYKNQASRYLDLLNKKSEYLDGAIDFLNNLRYSYVVLSENTKKPSPQPGTSSSTPAQIKVVLRQSSFFTSIFFSVVGGILLGWIVYFTLVSNAYNSLSDQIQHTKIVGKIVERDPALYGLLMDNSPTDEEDLIWRILNDLGVITSGKAIEEIGPGVKEPLRNVVRHSSQNLLDVNFIDLIIQTTGFDKNNQPVNGNNTNLKKIVADCLSRKPASLSILNGYQKNSDASDDPGFMKTIFPYFIPRGISPSSWGGEINPNIILTSIYRKNDIQNTFKNVHDKADSTSQVEAYENYRQLRDFHQRLFMSINDEPLVLEAKNWVFYVEGPEQLVMFILTSMALFMLVQRLLALWEIGVFAGLDSNKTKSWKKWYKWIIVTLPLFGFIGTKRGLSEALSQSDAIIRAGTEINQAMTMSNITYALGIAFTTTLVALVLGILLNFFDNLVMGLEEEAEAKKNGK